MGTDFPDVMVDLETTGLQPDHANIIQIAAVRFNLKERTVDPKVFDQCLSYSPNRYWDEGTRAWWAQQEPHILPGLRARARDPYLVLKEFSEWAGRNSPTLWAKPIHFEWPLIQSYYREYDLRNPFFFRNANDVNSWIRSRHFPEPPFDYQNDIEFEGDAHNAIFDCFHQIKCLFACMEATGG